MTDINQIVAHEKAFRTFKSQAERDLFDSLSPRNQVETMKRKPFECEYCGLTMAIEDGFCDEACEQAFYDHATAAEILEHDVKDGYIPVKNLEDERAQREEAAEARRDLAREADQANDYEIEAKRLERKDRDA